MAKRILILCDDRDVEIAAAARAAFEQRGLQVTALACDAAAETLGASAREQAAGADAVVVVVREAGRGNRLLHAAEDEPRAARVLSLLVDSSPDLAVSARTERRIATLGDTLSAGWRGSPQKKRRWPLAAALMAVAAAIAVALVLLLSHPKEAPDSGPQVLLTGTLSNTGWMVFFHLRKEAAHLEYKRPSDRDFVSTGLMEPTSGPGMVAPHAKTYVVMNDLHGRVPFLVRYQTVEGEELGPFEVVFDTAAQSVASVKRLLADVPQWVDFSRTSARRLCYFSTLLTYKYALRSIRYGIDRDVPDRDVHFEPREVPGIDNGDLLLIDVPENAASMVVEIMYLDGTSDRKRFTVQY